MKDKINQAIIHIVVYLQWHMQVDVVDEETNKESHSVSYCQHRVGQRDIPKKSPKALEHPPPSYLPGKKELWLFKQGNKMNPTGKGFAKQGEDHDVVKMRIRGPGSVMVNTQY